ncbi:anthranilate synthase component I [Umboniibacter marinipuniceus]|uniref:Anthranilate synthase component 1 n=1 Tax=Umboniibacter marinipuniceus TaxID=569599 RepID=A0A3M0A6A9_9GAMM|nr:anthranilate synthase component I [Umboniibacter marinipuniceus]RMA80126.1 anthranilate synthase component 1 [Umboniibacter marinipuniceus]
MKPETFYQFGRQGYNYVPLVREVVADLDTPVSCYLKLANHPYSFLFESVEGGEKWGRYSIIGLPCEQVLKVYEQRVEITHNGVLQEAFEVANPLDYIDEYRHQFKVPEIEGLPRFHGGLVGYFSYDTVRFVEPKLQGATLKREIDTPDVLMMLARDVIVFDNLSGTLKIITHANPTEDGAYDSAQQRLRAIEANLKAAQTSVGHISLDDDATIEDEVRLHTSEADFKAAVNQVKEYVLAGDTMQVVLSQRMSMAFEHTATDLYRALRLLNPSPYMYCLNLADHHVVGSSPEILARLEQGEVTVRPIAGTRKRGKTEADDQALEADLLADPKEIAEHLMLIDLGRNDVGRVAESGTVKLTEKMVVERYSHVMHITSNVTGKLRAGLGCMDVLRAAMPAGTLSGAPKVRAMEIIDELESSHRGIYGGAVGYIGWNGNMDTAIAIRTAVLKDGRLYVQAGAGVVADSQPDLEWQETRNKARAVLRAASMLSAKKERQQ